MDVTFVMSDSSVVQKALAVARARWPHLRLSEATFDAYLTKIDAPRTAVESYAADLVLACACANKDNHALSIFEQVHISCIASYVTRLQLSAERLEELRQLLRMRLFTGSSPRILRYSGKGPLGAWLRIMAIRLALDELKAQPLECPLDADAIGSLIEDSRTDNHAVRIAWQPRFRQAIETSLAGLPPREKTVLRLHYIDGLNIEAIGTLYQVHRATVARWLLAVRSDVLAEIRKQLSIVSPLSNSEMRDIFAELEAELYVSISRILGRPAQQPGS